MVKFSTLAQPIQNVNMLFGINHSRRPALSATGQYSASKPPKEVALKWCVLKKNANTSVPMRNNQYKLNVWIIGAFFN